MGKYLPGMRSCVWIYRASGDAKRPHVPLYSTPAFVHRQKPPLFSGGFWI